ncbi:hypothetical protein LCGC14_0712520, partial [marine sediment metagenome]
MGKLYKSIAVALSLLLIGAPVLGAATKAKRVRIVDAGSYYTGTEVETALQEVGESSPVVGTRAYYKFNGNVLDAASGGSDGTVVAEASTTNHVLSLDSVDDAVSVAETTSIDISSESLRNMFPTSISRDDYEAWPGIDIDSSGNLYTVYRTAAGSTHAFDADGLVAIRRSTDNGETWSAATTVADNASLDDRNANILIFDASGTETILVVYNTWDNTDARAKCKKSTVADWTNFGSEISLKSGANQRGCRGRPILISGGSSDGDIIVPLYDAWTNDNTYVVSSSDDGDTWSDLATVTTADGEEMSIIQLKSGGSFTDNLLAIMRDNAGKFWKVTSADAGATWAARSEETQLPVGTGTPCDLVRLSDDTLLANYAHNDTTGYETHIYSSTDEGTTWTKDIEVLHGFSNSSYPQIVEIDSTNLIMVGCTNGQSTASSDVYVKQIAYPLVELAETDVMSVFAWVKRDVITNFDAIVTKDEVVNCQAFMMRVKSDGNLMVATGGDVHTTETATSVNDTKWHHVGFTKTTRTTALYVDGVSVKSHNAGIILDNALDVQIGRRYNNADTPTYTDYYDGLIDEVKIYNRALSAAEVRALFESEDRVILHADTAFLSDLQVEIPLSTAANSVGIKLSNPDNAGFIGMSNNTSGASFQPFFSSRGTADVGLTIQGEPFTDTKARAAVVIRGKDAGSNGALESSDILRIRNWTTELVVVDKDGNMGIGTVSPQELLHVGAGTDASDITATDLLVT